MPISIRRVLRYRHHKPKNLAVVRINGDDIYLGRYDAPNSTPRMGDWTALQGDGS